jgi:hypothetical protein
MKSFVNERQYPDEIFGEEFDANNVVADVDLDIDLNLLKITKSPNVPFELLIDRIKDMGFETEHEYGIDYAHYTNYWKVASINTMLKYDDCVFPIIYIRWNASNQNFLYMPFDSNKRFVVHMIHLISKSLILYDEPNYIIGRKSYRIDAHANVLLIDNKNKQITWFEPNGEDERIIKKFKTELLYQRLIGATMYLNYNFTFSSGFQRFDSTVFSGLCERWCAAYAYFKVKYADRYPIITVNKVLGYTPMHLEFAMIIQDPAKFRNIVYFHTHKIRKFYEYIIKTFFFNGFGTGIKGTIEHIVDLLNNRPK